MMIPARVERSDRRGGYPYLNLAGPGRGKWHLRGPEVLRATEGIDDLRARRSRVRRSRGEQRKPSLSDGFERALDREVVLHDVVFRDQSVGDGEIEDERDSVADPVARSF